MSPNLIGLSSICFLFLSCFRTAIAGYQAQALPDLERRARNYHAKGDNYDSYVNDEYLGPGWFSVGNYTMPDSSTLPTYSSCGTRNPIYIKGHHPNITDTNCTVYDVVTCEWYDFDNCSNERNILVRQCDIDTQYYLARTSNLAGYCMDPPELANVTDFDEAPTDVSIGDLTVDAKLEFETVKNSTLPYIRFSCFESPAVDRSDKEDLRYSTYWFVESTLFKVFERVTKVMPLNESELTDQGYTIGFTIRCGIRMSTSLTGYQTEMKSSKNFYAGVKIHPSVINMKKNDTANVILESTIPYGCYAPVNDPVQDSAKCTILVNLHYPQETINSCSIDDTDVGSLLMVVNDIVNYEQAKCGVIISGFLPKHNGSQQMENVSLSLTSPFFSNSDPTEYRLTLRTSGNNQHKIWKDALLPEMQLNIFEDERFESNICYSHVDPHMCTSDGCTYENNSFKGSFILYYHDSGIQVQMKTTHCNRNIAYCACAVAVRAGGDVFLINRCGGLRFIDMTSCKDGGVLIIRKNSEVDYQVQTNIGTLIKITLLTGDYANMMNIDIHMAPKDLDRIKGLCGTFDNNTDNDFHDRNGATVSENEFLNAWTLKDTDVDLLHPTCNLNVATWTADNQALYCSCQCHDTEYDCGAPEAEAMCSPSQYVNCTVSNSKTSELCEYFNKRCSMPLRAKRDEKLMLKQDPEIEMRRLAARADLPDKFIAKREGKRAVDEYITEEMARSECTNYLHTEVIEQKLELLGAFNLSQAIEECTWDVNTGQDRGWMETHKQAALSAIETSYKRDANYTISHTDELKEFKTKTCPYDCDGNGVCLENGTCSCSSDFFGPTCNNNKSEGPVIEDIEGGGFCDQNYDRDCSCSAVQLEALHEFFFCKRVMIQKTVSGESRVVGTDLVPGWYRNMYNGECCFEDYRRKRSTDSETDVLHYKHEISVSNDGQNYGPIATLYVFDSLCVEVVTDDGGNASFYLKEDTCIIEGTCYEAQAVDLSNYCFRCMPDITQYNWTEGCIKDKDESQSSTFTVGKIIGLVVGVVSICVAVAVAVYFKHMKKPDRTVGPFQEFSGAAAMSRPSSSRPVFDRTQLEYPF